MSRKKGGVWHWAKLILLVVVGAVFSTTIIATLYKVDFLKNLLEPLVNGGADTSNSTTGTA